MIVLGCFRESTRLVKKILAEMFSLPLWQFRIYQVRPSAGLVACCCPHFWVYRWLKLQMIDSRKAKMKMAQQTIMISSNPHEINRGDSGLSLFFAGIRKNAPKNIQVWYNKKK